MLIRLFHFGLALAILSVFCFTQSFAQTTVSFQDGVDSYSGAEDTYIHETFPNANFGSDITLKADGADNSPAKEAVTFLKWDISSIPTNGTVISATVTLDFHNSSVGDYFLYAQNSTWAEGAATWLDLNSGTEPLGTIAPGTTGVTDIVLNAKGLGLIQNWIVDPVNNNGIAIRTGGSNNGIAAHSREFAGFHPKLEITYSDDGKPTISQLLAMVEALNFKADSNRPHLDELHAKFQGISRTGSTIQFEGMNVQIVNGLNSTYGDQDSGIEVNGLGNLIVGYDEDNVISGEVISDKSGSHNVVVGPGHSYPSYACFIAGDTNSVYSPFATISGGKENQVDAFFNASITGGRRNIVENWGSVAGGFDNYSKGGSISGGMENVNDSFASNVIGGRKNQARRQYAAVSGGFNNRSQINNANILGGSRHVAISNDPSNFHFGTISGGSANFIKDFSSTIQGGLKNKIEKIDFDSRVWTSSNISGGEENWVDRGSISGGRKNIAVRNSSVNGGTENEAGNNVGDPDTGLLSSISGGFHNKTDGDHSSVSGGSYRSVTGEDDWAAGGLFEDQ